MELPLGPLTGVRSRAALGSEVGPPGLRKTTSWVAPRSFGRSLTMTSMVCRKCGASLSSIDEVLHHAESTHPAVSPNSAGDHLCPGCPATFRQLLLLQRHLADAHGM